MRTMEKVVGDTAAALAFQEDLHPVQETEAEKMRMKWLRPFLRDSGENVYEIRDEIENLMWEKAGLVRNGVHLREAAERLEEWDGTISSMSPSPRPGRPWPAPLHPPMFCPYPRPDDENKGMVEDMVRGQMPAGVLYFRFRFATEAS